MVRNAPVEAVSETVRFESIERKVGPFRWQRFTIAGVTIVSAGVVIGDWYAKIGGWHWGFRLCRLTRTLIVGPVRIGQDYVPF